MMTTPEKPMSSHPRDQNRTSKDATRPCPSVADLRSLSLGNLSDADSSILLQHVDRCSACQAELETVDVVEDSLISDLRAQIEPDAVESEQQCDLALAKALGALAEVHRGERGADFGDFPQSIGEYEIVRSLGHGGMGRVFLARHTKLGREVALKVIADHRLSDAKVRKRFENEMQAIGRLSHPNIVTAYDAREIDSTAVLVTEYIDGMDLGKIVESVGQLSIADACQAAKQVAAALQYTGDQGFVHRDIKPSNVMVSRTGQVKLLDLGLARIHSDDTGRSEMTGTGQTMGTADYISPEQVTDSHDVDIRSDLYSLGCTLQKLLTGQAPFATEKYPNAFTKMNAHVSEIPAKVSNYRDDVPKELVKLVANLLVKDPDQRPKSPLDVARTLEKFSNGNDLEQLVQTAFEAEVRPHASRPVPNLSTKPTPQVSHWWQRKIPITTAIATGFFGAILGLLLGIVITIEAPDGTKTVIEVADNSKLTIQSKNDPAQPVGKTLQNMNATEAFPDRKEGELLTDTVGPPIPLMLSILIEDAEKGALTKPYTVRHLATSGSEFVKVYEDTNGLWCPVGEAFDTAPTCAVDGQRYVLVSSDHPKEGIRWTDLEGQIRYAQSSNNRVEVALKNKAAEKLSELTRNNMLKKLAIIVDGRVVAAPRIMSEISNRFVITGNLQREQIKVLMDIAGAPPMSASERDEIQRLKDRLDRSKNAEMEAVEKDVNADSILKKLMKIGTGVQNVPGQKALTNLTKIGLAFHNFESAYKKFPASAGSSVGGWSHVPNKPTQPFSWRVAILPFIEQQALYEEYRFHEAWDSEHNSKLLQRMPDVFRSDSTMPEGHTRIQSLAGKDRAMGVTNPTGFQDITDGTSTTILLIEASDTVPWTKPQDVTGEVKLPKGVKRILLLDGVAREFKSIDADLLKKMVTRNGREVIDSSLIESLMGK